MTRLSASTVSIRKACVLLAAPALDVPLSVAHSRIRCTFRRRASQKVRGACRDAEKRVARISCLLRSRQAETDSVQPRHSRSCLFYQIFFTAVAMSPARTADRWHVSGTYMARTTQYRCKGLLDIQSRSHHNLTLAWCRTAVPVSHSPARCLRELASFASSLQTSSQACRSCLVSQSALAAPSLPQVPERQGCSRS